MPDESRSCVVAQVLSAGRSPGAGQKLINSAAHAPWLDMAGLKDFTSFCVGYSPKLDAADAVQWCKRVSENRLFNLHTDPNETIVLIHRRIGEGFPRVNWSRLAKGPPDGINSEKIGVQIEAELQNREWKSDVAISSLAKGPWENCYVDVIVELSQKRSLGLLLNRSWTGAGPRSVFLISGSRGWPTFESFLDYVLVWLQGTGNVTCEPAKTLPAVRVIKREWDGLRIEDVGQVKEEFGVVQYKAVTIGVASDEIFFRWVERVKTLPGLKDLQIRGLGWYIEAPKWKEARERILRLGIGCTGLELIGRGFRLTQVNPSDEMAEYDLIPLGFLGGSGVPGGEKIASILRRYCVAVDLHREAGGWSFGFTSVENELTKRDRAKLVGALNGALGGLLLTRTPEERWGASLT